MITDFLLGHHWLTPAILIGLVVFGPLAGRWLFGHPRLARGLLAAALVPVAVLTLVPQDQRGGVGCTLDEWLLPTPDRVELFANVVLFVAPVLLAGVATGRPLAMVATGSALSAVLEGVQALIPAIGRSCDTNDGLCNTIGAGVGGLLAVVAVRLARRDSPVRA